MGALTRIGHCGFIPWWEIVEARRQGLTGESIALGQPKVSHAHHATSQVLSNHEGAAPPDWIFLPVMFYLTAV